MLRLNRKNIYIYGRDPAKNWTSPFLVAKCIRCLTYPIRVAVLCFRGTVNASGRRVNNHRARDERDGENGAERRSAREEALDEYRNVLENTFSDKEPIDDVMGCVNTWIDGE